MVKRVFVAVLMMCPAVVLAQAPQLLGYQGRLVKTDGTPESGNAQMRFGLFGTETGGSSLWEETQAVSIAQGYYSTYLGRMTTFPATLFDTGTLWLEVSVQAPGDTQFRTMTPRQRVGSVAFALNARSVKGGTVDATSVSVNGTQVIDSNGKLTASAGYTAGPGISIDGTTRAISVSSSGCNTGQVLQWNGSAWQCASVSGTGGGISGVSGTAPITVMNGTTSPVVSVSVGTTAGTVAAGNDSRFGNATSIGGVAVASSAPTNGQVLAFNGMTWNPTSVATGGVASVTAGTGLTGGTITTTGTIAIADGGVGSAQLAAGAVTFDKLAAAGCTANQVLRFNGTTWTCATVGSSNSAVADLVANFEFEETGNTFNDTSGLGNNATFSSGLTAGAVGHTGSGANFSGGVAAVAAGNTIPDSPQVSVEAWLWPQSVSSSDQRVVIAKQGAWSLRYLTGAGISDLDFTITGRAASPSCTVTTTGAGISTTGWTHISARYDGLSIAILINGQVSVQATCQKGAVASNAGTPLSFGGPATGAGNRYLGFLDSVRIRSSANVPVLNDFPDNPFPGSVLLTRDQMNQINAWTGRPYQKWQLCYRKSRDGATAAAFHAACDYRGPTMTIIRTSNRLLGGYSRLSWNQSAAYGSYDSSAFIFSLTSNKRYHHMGYPASSYPAAIYNNASYGTTFGNGHDIYVNASMDIGYCNFPYSYNCNRAPAGTPNNACSQELCGVNSGTAGAAAISELEVWFEE